MKNIFYLLLLLLTINTASAQVSMMGDVSQPYLNQLIELGRKNYPKFKWTNERVLAAKSAYAKTRMAFFDFITLSYVYFPGNNFSVINNTNGTSNFLSGYQAGVFLNVGNMLAKPAGIRQAKHEYQAMQYDKDATDLGIDQMIRQRYYTYIAAINVLKIKTQSVTDAADVVKNVKYRFEKGQATFDIYSQALLAQSTLNQEKIAAESNLLIAKSALEELIGVPLESVAVK